LNEWQQLDLCFSEDSHTMNEMGDVDQFQLLEEKVDSLIALIIDLRNEKEDLRNEKERLAEKVQIQERKITELTEQAGTLDANRDKAKQRIVSLLEKIKQIDV